MSIVIENHNPQTPWETVEDVYCNLLENFHIRKKIYQHARKLFKVTNGVVLVDHELFEEPLYVTRLFTEKYFIRLVRKRLGKIFVEQERKRASAEADN